MADETVSVSKKTCNWPLQYSRRLDLGGGQTVTGDVDDIVNTSLDPVVAVLVPSTRVTEEEVSRVGTEVGVEVSLVVAVDGTSNSGPRTLGNKDTLDVSALENLAVGRVEDCDVDTEEGESGGSWLGSDTARDGGDHVGTGLGHPVSVDDGTLAVHTGVFVVPVPGLGVDRLTDGTEDTEGRKVASLDKLVTHAAQETDSSGSSVELGSLPLFNKVPVSGGVGVDGSGLEHGGGSTEGKGTVDNVGMAGNPSYVGHASKLVVRVDVKDVLDGEVGTEEVSTSCVDNTLGLAGRARGVENEEGVLRVHVLTRGVGGNLVTLLVPPLVTALSHGNLVASAAEDENVLDKRALSESGVDNCLGGNGLSATATFIGGDEDLALAVIDTVTERLGRESCKDCRVDGTNTSTSKECGDSLPGHRKADISICPKISRNVRQRYSLDGYSVALFHTP